MLKIPQFSICDTQSLREIKFGNFTRSNYAIIVIFEALNFDSQQNSTFPLKKMKIKKYSAHPVHFFSFENIVS